MANMRIGMDLEVARGRFSCPRCGGEAIAYWRWHNCGAMEYEARCDTCSNRAYIFTGGGCWFWGHDKRVEEGDIEIFKEAAKVLPRVVSSFLIRFLADRKAE